MITIRKVRLMARMAIFEDSREGKASLALSKFFRGDYLRWELLKTVANVTMGFLILIVLAAMYNAEYIIKNATNVDWMALGFRVLGIYMVVMIVYVAFTTIMALYRFGRLKKHYSKYDRSLRELEEFYKEDAEIAGDALDEDEDADVIPYEIKGRQ